MTIVPATRRPRLGQNWSVCVEAITYFGGNEPNRTGEATLFKIFRTSGGVLDAESWVMSTGLRIPFCEVDPIPVSNQIRSIIASHLEDFQAGKVYLGVMPHIGLTLALEGILTQDALDVSVETLSQITAMITLDGLDIEIRISPYLPRNFSAYNLAGKIV